MHRMYGPVSASTGVKDFDTTWLDDQKAIGHYLQSISGGHNGSAKCYHLVGPADLPVGFMAMNTVAQDLEDVTYAFLAIDYVYLREEFRGTGRGLFMAGYASAIFSSWLSDLRSSSDITQPIVVRTTHDVVTSAGRRFAISIDRHLEQYCKSARLDFQSRVLPALAA